MGDQIIYLDHAATTPPDEAVIAAMADCMHKIFFNGSSPYSCAGEARRIHRLCRRQLGAMLHCPPEDLYFTSGGTESNNWIAKAFSGGHVVASAIEHASLLSALEGYHCQVTLVSPGPDGRIAPGDIQAALTPHTRLICLQAANNETGVIQPLEEVCAIARARRIHLHTDGVQAFGHIPLDASNCDSMSLSAHKLYGPRGVGCLYIRQGAAVPPLIYGGHQEGGLRAGTENTPAIWGFHKAAQLAQQDLLQRGEREQNLLNSFINKLKSVIPDLRLLGEGSPRLPGIAALCFPALEAEKAIAQLDLQGILVSGGAACASRSGVPSHVYTAMGLNEKEAARVLRISIGRHTTADELTTAARAIEALTLRPAPQNVSL